MISLAMLIFTATTSVLSGLQRAPSAFSGDEGFVISETGAPTIFSSTLDMDMVAALESFPQIVATSPEVFAFASWNDVSFVMRGLDMYRLNMTGPSFTRFDLAAPLDQDGVKTALVGGRLAERLGLHAPANLSLVGSYSSKIEAIEAVGTYATGTSLDDEMLVPLNVARFLSGVPEDRTSIIRVSTTDPAWLSNILSPSEPRFTLYDLHASHALVALNQPVTVSVGIKNWGGEAGSAQVTFSEANLTLREKQVTLNSSSSTSVSGQFVFASIGVHTLKVSVSGDFPVTLYTNITVVNQYLTVSRPMKVLLDTYFNVTVNKYSGEPVAAFVTFLNRSYLTDSLGRASILADVAGDHQLRANLSGYEDGVASVYVADPAQYPNSFSPFPASFTVSPATVQVSEDVTCTIVIDNDGAEPGTYAAVVVDSMTPVARSDIQLDGMSSYIWKFKIHFETAGTHSLSIGNSTVSVLVEPWFADNPGLVQLVVRYGGYTSLSSSAEIPIYQAAKLSEGNVASALFAIGAVSAVLTVLAITSIFSREIHESRRRLGILRTVGAPNTAVRRMVFEQALENGLAGTAIGLAMGVFVADWLARAGRFLLFGHELRLTVDSGFLLLVFAAALIICVSSALASSEMALRETSIRSIKGTEAEQRDRKDLDELME